VVGPNSFGLLVTDPEVSLNASLSPVMPPRGRLGFFSQSGALGVALLDNAAQRGLGISSFVSAGNRVDVSGNDLMQFWEDDLSTDAVTRDVFVNRDGRAVKVSVDVGIADDTYQEIVSGLKPGDEVVTGPDRVLRALEDGDRISPTLEKRSNGTTDNESGGGTVSISAD